MILFLIRIFKLFFVLDHELTGSLMSATMRGGWALPSLSRTSTGDAQAASNQRKSRLAMDGACGEKLLENFADAKHHTEHSLQMVKKY